MEVQRKHKYVAYWMGAELNIELKYVSNKRK